MLRRGLATLLLAVLAGCCAPHPPLPHQHQTNPWRPQPPTALAALADRPGASRLQVIVSYADYTCMHAALRLLVPGEAPLFWDPGGNYGNLEPVLLPRRANLVLQPPTLADYLAFRWSVETRSVEILQFDLPPEQTRTWRALLLDNLRDDGVEPVFRSATPGLFCAHAISSFLHDFGGERFRPLEPTMFPHTLAASLYRLDPDRIWRFDRDGAVVTHP